MSAVATSSAIRPESATDYLILESGDRLDTRQFMRRYGRTPESFKAELIEGIVFVMAPAREDVHGVPDSILQSWLGYYAAFTAEVTAATNATAIFDEENTLQPDAYLRKSASVQCRLDEEGYLNGPPELVIEIAASSASIDAHKKKEAYRRAGVNEYLLWRTQDGAVDWWQLEEGEYQPLPIEDGVIRSRVFPGLALNVNALLAGDRAAVLTTLQNEIAKRPS